MKQLTTKKELIKLYINQQLSTGSISKKLNCTHTTILNYLNKFGIQKRSRLGNRNPVNISKEILVDLYVTKRVTQEQIAEKYNHSRFGIQRWMKKYKINARSLSDTHTKYPKTNFSLNPNEKSYMLGFRLGDLNVYRAKKQICVRCSTTIENQVLIIKEMFEKYGNVHIWRARRGTSEINILLNSTFRFLLPKEDKIPKWILNKTELFLHFLAGYSDAEGSYYLRKPYYKTSECAWAVFEIQTYDKNIIQAIYESLTKLGIESKFSRSRSAGHVDKRKMVINKDCWRVSINKKQSLWNFVKLMEKYHRHRSKIEDLKKVKENIIFRNELPHCQRIIL